MLLSHYETYLSIVRNSLAEKKFKNFYKILFLNLHCVSRSYKCGYLIDKVCVESNSILDIVNQLTEAQLLSSCIRVVLINSDIVILNVDALLSHLKTYQLFINISSGLSCPEIMNENCEQIKNMKLFIQKSFTNISETNDIISLDTRDLCIPSIFGLVLNFPIVYWFDKDYTLSCTLLALYKIVIVIDQADSDPRRPSHQWPFELYSFSSPEVLDNQTHVNQFLETLSNKVTNINEENVSFNLIRTEKHVIDVVL